MAILRRWLSLIAYAATASAICLVFGDLALAPLESFTAQLAHLPPAILCGSLLVLVVVAAWRCGHGRWTGFFGLRHLHSYPPLSLAVAIGLSMIITVRGWHRGWDLALDPARDFWWAAGSVPWWLYAAVPVMVGLAFVAEWNESAPDASRVSAQADDEWIDDDREIEDPCQDRFGADAIARRMAERLSDVTGCAPTMAIEGELGSGKSTIRNLVRHHLNPSRNILFAHISLWPFESAEAAVAGVLGEVKVAMAERVDATALTGIASEYVSVAEGVGGVWGSLLGLLRPGHSPEEVLAHVDEILKCADLRLVVWVEDLERFAENGDSPAAMSKVDRTLARPVLALLYLLDRADRISVVLSGTSQAVRIDPGKLARFVERVPPLGPDHVRNVIESLRTRCLSTKIVDSLSEADRQKSFAPTQEREKDLTELLSPDRVRDLPTAVTALIRTPRSLKSVLRIVRECWRELPGEIDFDSMLIATVIRVARPDLFALIDSNIDQLRRGRRDPLLGGLDSKLHPVFEELDKALDAEPPGVERSALRWLVSRLLPNALREKPLGDDYLTAPQAMGVHRHADYWSRYTAQAIPERELLDQPLLRDIARWKQNGGPTDLVRRLLDPAKSAQLESFVGKFSSEDLCRLLEEFCTELVSGNHRQLNYAQEQSGIVAIWRMMHARRPSPSRVEEVVEAILPKLATYNLALAFDVHYYFTYPDGSVPSLVDPGVSKRLAILLRDILLNRLLTADSLLRALRVENPYSVLQVVWELPRVRTGELDGLPMPQWPEVASVLLDAAERAPGIVLPHIVPFVTQSGTKNDVKTDESGTPRLHREHTATFIESRAKELFDLDRLFKLFVANECPPDLDPAMRECYRAVREAAVAALTKDDRQEGESDLEP